jgi:hypothetical protein
MPFDARKMALCRPPAVAIHDDGDMLGQNLEVDLPDQHFVRMASRNPRQQFLATHVAS